MQGSHTKLPVCLPAARPAQMEHARARTCWSCLCLCVCVCVHVCVRVLWRMGRSTNACIFLSLLCLPRDHEPQMHWCRIRPCCARRRYLVSQYLLYMANIDAGAASEAQRIPFWAMCNAAATPFIGSWRQNTEGITTLAISNKDCRPHSVEGMERLDDHIGQYCARRMDGGQDAGSLVAADAVYDMLGSPNIKTRAKQSSSISISFAWQEATEMLSVPPSSATAALHIRAVPGDSQSVAHSLHSDVSALVGMDTHAKAFARAKENQTSLEEVWPPINTQSQLESTVRRLCPNRVRLLCTQALCFVDYFPLPRCFLPHIFRTVLQ